MLGNDYQQADWSEYDPYEVALSQGLRAGDPTKLQTIELNPFVSTSYDDPTWPPLLDLASAYTYYPTYDAVLKAYNDTPTQPVFMVEANYEFENNTGGPETIDETLRRQEYWTMLSGATGQLYGNGYTWPLTNPDWKDHFDTTAVDQLGLMVKLFTPLAWQDLVPDQSHTFLIGGAEEYGTTGDVMENTYATACADARRNPGHDLRAGRPHAHGGSVEAEAGGNGALVRPDGRVVAPRGSSVQDARQERRRWSRLGAHLPGTGRFMRSSASLPRRGAGPT